MAEAQINAYARIADGVVVNSVLADAAFANGRGLVLLPAGAGIGWLYDGKTFKAPPAGTNSPTPDDVNAERDRRLSRGITFQNHVFQTDPDSRERIDRSRISAMAAIMGGVQTGDLRWHGLPVDFFWIAADDTRVPMDAQTMVALGNAMAAREGLLIVAGNDIKQRIAAGQAVSIGDDALWPA